MRFQPTCPSYLVLFFSALCSIVLCGQAFCLDGAAKPAVSSTSTVGSAEVGPQVQKLEDSMRYLDSAVGALEQGGTSVVDESHCGSRPVPSLSINQRLRAINKQLADLTQRINAYNVKNQTQEKERMGADAPTRRK